ncbi:MFS transporter [Acetivibrio cellulolyticus]|uniref:MFS transporter n=1 Tax=Acetivibrio cellulolyticus TaxID=35830 RepID=UPI0001E2DE41|nr:MFS transporter [Acetivibrio cellulolyticus]
MSLNNKNARIITNKPFMLLLFSQGISNFGDAFQAVAATMLLVKITGSGLAASYALICTPLASLFLSPIAGVLGDIFSGKRILIIIDILRGIIVMLFTINCNVGVIYILIFLLNSLDILYNPARNKVITSVVDSKDLIVASSLQSGVFGAAFIFGTLIAGIGVGVWGLNMAFTVNSLSFFTSAMIIIFVKCKKSYVSCYGKLSIYGIWVDIKESFCYSLKFQRIAELLEIGFVMSLAITSINITFYSFAFDTLGITSKGWSIMLSILYGTNLVAMFVSMIFARKTKKTKVANTYLFIFAVSVIWLLYSVLNDLHSIIMLQLIEGTALSLLWILLGSFLLIETKKGFVGRVTACNDFLCNVGKLISIPFTYMFLKIFRVQFLFVINSFILIAFLAYRLVILLVRKRHSNRLFSN